jgi:Tfp pilus assembly protein PilF
MMLKSRLLGERCAAVAIAAAACTGCASHRTSPNSPYAAVGESDRNTAEAERLTREAAQIMDSNPNKAEKLLRDALGKDLYHGPAHNNLGVVFLSRGELYSAASEFEFARKLMPGHPDPRINLALTLERAGRVEDAMKNYAAALEVYPDHIGAMQGLVRLQIRHDCRDDRTNQFLENISLRGETTEWRDWARASLPR